MATTIEKIQTLLSKVSGSEKEVKFYAEARLNDGRVVATEEDAMAVGVAVKVLEDDGVAYPLETGSYTLEDGTALVITDGIIQSIGEEVEETEAEKEEEEMAKKDETEMAKKMYDKFEEIPSEEMAKKMIDFIKEEMRYEEKEDMSEQTEEIEGDNVEFSSVVGELITRLESIETKLSEIENTPADTGVSVNPTGTDYAFNQPNKDVFSKVSRKDVLNMTTSERAKFMITNKLTRI